MGPVVLEEVFEFLGGERRVLLPVGVLRLLPATVAVYFVQLGGPLLRRGERTVNHPLLLAVRGVPHRRVV
jgi:hypothetical protein